MFKEFFNKIQNKKLTKEFNMRKRMFAKKNYNFILNQKLIPYVKSDALYNEGLLLTEKDARHRAINLLAQQKKQGVVDALYRVVKFQG